MRHAIAGVGRSTDILLRDRGPETRPSRARIKLRIGTEQRVVAANATVESLVMQVVGGASEGPFRPLLARHFKLQRGQLFFPFLFALADFCYLNATQVLPVVAELDYGYRGVVIGFAACIGDSHRPFDAGRQTHSRDGQSRTRQKLPT